MSTPERQDDQGEHGYGGIPAQKDDEHLEQAQQERPEDKDEDKDRPAGSGGAPVPEGTGMLGDEGAPGTGDQD